MPECVNHPRNKKTRLCMGCGQYFCDQCGEEVHGVFYCKGCESTAQEFAETKEMGLDFIADEMSEDQAKWEAGFSSEAMVVINRKNLATIQEPLPVEDIFGGLVRRGFAFTVDWIIAVPKVVLLMRLQGLGTPQDQTYVFYLECIVSFFYFWFFNYTTGMTVGKLFTDLRLVDVLGRQVSLGQAFGRATISFLSMLFFFVIVPLHVLCYLFTSSKQGLHDLLFSTYVVRDTPWKKLAKEAIAHGGSMPKKKKVELDQENLPLSYT